MIEILEIPEVISCSYAPPYLRCEKGEVALMRALKISGITLSIAGAQITLQANAGNRKTFARMKAAAAHIHNIFKGLATPFAYALEACNVHFPMTLKVEKNDLIITNFLGEKVARRARILPGVDVELKGTRINISSADLEAAGQTAANIEKATKIRNRDRRIFQDGIYIVSRPGGMK